MNDKEIKVAQDMEPSTDDIEMRYRIFDTVWVELEEHLDGMVHVARIAGSPLEGAERFEDAMGEAAETFVIDGDEKVLEVKKEWIGG